MRARDVAERILTEYGSPMSPMKLQKLLYYCQAWSLVWDGQRLFDDKIEAWEKGPVVRDVWEQNRGAFSVATVKGDANALRDRDAIETIRAVLRFYGKKSGQQLSDLTHSEQPWIKAFRGKSNAVITRASMYEYYSSQEKRLAAEWQN